MANLLWIVFPQTINSPSDFSNLRSKAQQSLIRNQSISKELLPLQRICIFFILRGICANYQRKNTSNPHLQGLHRKLHQLQPPQWVKQGTIRLQSSNSHKSISLICIQKDPNQKWTNPQINSRITILIIFKFNSANASLTIDEFMIKDGRNLIMHVGKNLLNSQNLFKHLAFLLDFLG